jgi:hypothetical protein
MLLALLALTLLAVVLVLPPLVGSLRRRRRPRRRRRRRSHELVSLVDPGRERRAEQRAQELLRSCVNDEEWAMYRDLGFIRVYGRASRSDARGPRPSRPYDAEAGVDAETGVDEERGAAAGLDDPLEPSRADHGARLGRGAGGRQGGAARPAASGAAEDAGEPRYAYLIYPHKPVFAYEPGTRRLLSEYCVEFPDLTEIVTGLRLPDSDDVLAKWMALTGDEARLLRGANMHLPGRQLDPSRVRRDLWRLEEWERRRRRAAEASRR